MNKQQKKIFSAIAAIVTLVLGYFGIDLFGDNAINQSNEPQVTQQSNNSDNAEHNDSADIDRDGHYTDAQNVKDFIEAFGELPDNYLTKDEAYDLGWEPREGNLHDVAPGMSIGGDHFGNFEGLLPEASGRDYYEADINYNGGHRGAERLVFSDDGLYFYTDDHYETFEEVE